MKPMYLKNSINGNVTLEENQPQNSELLTKLGYFMAAVIGDNSRSCYCEVYPNGNLDKCVKNAISIVDHVIELALIESDDIGPFNKLMDIIEVLNAKLGKFISSCAPFYVAKLESGSYIHFYGGELKLNDDAKDLGESNAAGLVNAKSGETVYSHFANVFILLKSYLEFMKDGLDDGNLSQAEKMMNFIETIK